MTKQAEGSASQFPDVLDCLSQSNNECIVSQ